MMRHDRDWTPAQHRLIDKYKQLADLKDLRPGQLSAVKKIIDRHVEAQDTTAIVAPPRYGKTLIMRLAAYLLWKQERLSHAIILSPWSLLREQNGDKKKWRESILLTGMRMGLDQWSVHSVGGKNGPILMQNGELFSLMNKQMAHKHIDAICRQIREIRRRTGKPTLVFIDECQTESVENEWGKMVPQLIAAKAHVVLMTATAFRADRQRIPGFRWKTYDSQESLKQKVVREEERLLRQTFREVKTLIRLDPDVEVTIPQSYLESPPPLCHISRREIRVTLEDVGIEGDKRLLSEMNPKEAKAILGKDVVESEKVIRESLTMGRSSLQLFRKIHPGIKGIIYCRNDESEDIAAGTVNRHAHKISRIGAELGLSFRIVTLASEEDIGASGILSFGDGKEDFIIVKQMCGVGLDLPILKVCIDLSSTRTYPSWVQRIMRVATILDVVCDGKEVEFRQGHYISPNDPDSIALHEATFGELPPGYDFGEIGELSLVDSEPITEREPSPEPPQKPCYVVAEAVEGRYVDSSLKEASAQANKEKIGQLLSEHPALAAKLTLPELSDIVSHFDRQKGSDPLDEQEEPAEPEPGPDPSAEDLTLDEKVRVLKDKINKLDADTTSILINQGDPRPFSEIIKEIKAQCKRRARCNKKFVHIKDIAKLEEILVESRKFRDFQTEHWNSAS